MVWKGFIKAPLASEYTFELETDDGGMLLINNSPVIKDKIDGSPITDWLKNKRVDLNRAIQSGDFVKFLDPA